jgi:DNA-binding beta-propeller fold protein YncE
VTLRHVGFTPVPPGAKPGFDHADTYLDPRGGGLYVAHTGADRVDILDCRSGRYLGAIADLPGVAGVLIDTEQDFLFTSDRGANRVSLFRCSDQTLLGRVAVGPRPNALAYDRRLRRLFSFNLGEPVGTNCTASVVSVDERRVTKTIALPGRPRWAIYDDSTRSVYANIAEPAMIGVIEADVLAMSGAIPVPAAGPHGLAIVREERGASLWCAADAGNLVVLDRDSGAVETTLPLPGTPDVVMYDRDLARLYVAVGSPGTVSAFDVGRRVHLETIQTEEGAHTIGWDPIGRRVFVFQPKSCGVAIYEESP